MAAYLLRRAGQLVLVLLGVTLGTFSLLHLVPGDPARTLLGVHATDAEVAILRHRWGLDRPLGVQYTSYLGRLLHGDLGVSTYYDTSVSSLIRHALPVTLLVIAIGTVFAVALAVPLAVLAARRPNGWLDQAIRVGPLVGLGMPPFWIGFLLILLFARWLPLFPAGGYGQSLTDHAKSLVLPGLTIGLAMAPILIRSIRSSLLEVLASDYVTAAWAKGLSTMRIVGRHALRNTAIPTVSVLAVNVGFLLGGTAVMESVFGLPGLGSLMLDGIFHRDFDVVQSVTLVYAIVVVLVNLSVDVGYVLLDPRVVLAR